jgi:perosamine synthetase
MTTDIFGHPQKLDDVLAHVAHHGLPIIADACEALGSRYRTDAGEWVHAGSGAAATVVAFYPNKQITTGEGGMVLGDEPAMLVQLQALRNQGREAGDAWLRHSQIGFNYRLDELSAALGLVQMRRIDEILGRRSAVVAHYNDALADLEVGCPRAAEWADPSWFVYFLRVGRDRDRDAIVAAVNERGIASKAYFDIPIHRQPPYAGLAELVPEPLPNTEAAAADILILPFFSTMTADQVGRVADTVKEVLKA